MAHLLKTANSKVACRRTKSKYYFRLNIHHNPALPPVPQAARHGALVALMHNSTRQNRQNRLLEI
jgi:hypothetical protein